MVTYQVEKFSDCVEEIKPHLLNHYEELSVTKTFPMDPDWDAYARSNDEGKIIIVTCRKDGELVGYIVYFLVYNLHYQTMKTALEDVYYLAKAERKGRVGIKLFKFAEQVLKDIGVDRVIYGTKIHLDNSKLFEYLGYTVFEKLYSKMI